MTIATGGLAASFKRILRSAAEQASLHGELFWVEWQAERSRLLKVVITWIVGLLFASFALIFASISALAAAWDTPYRLHVGLGLAVVYAVGFVITRIYLGQLSRQGEGAFVATREQFTEEAAFLKELL